MSVDRLRSLVLGLVLLLGAAQAAAGEDTSCPPPLTRAETGPMGRADAIVLGDVLSVRAQRGLLVVQARVVRALAGPEPAGASLVILVRGPRPTLDPEAPSAPYLVETDRGRYVFYLLRGRGGVGWELDTLFPADEALGRERLAVLEAHLGLRRVPDREERARQTLTWLLETQASVGTWTRVHGAKELVHLAGVRPDLFDAAARQKLQRLAARATVPAQRSQLRRLFDALGETVPAPGAPSPAPPEPGEALDRALRAATTPEARIHVLEGSLLQGGPQGVGRLLDRLPTEPPEVRRWAVDALAEGGYRDALPRIVRLYAFEDDPEVLAAVVRAVGLLGGDEDVAWLGRRLGSDRVRREALFALARIRTPAARAALESARREAAAGGGGDDLVALVDYLLGDVFPEVERAAGREVRSAPH